MTSTETSTSTLTSTGESGEESGELVEVRYEHLQALGTHNSYHVAPGVAVQAWAYTHRPLDEQLEIGVRQFELDVWHDEAANDFAVYHVESLDEEVNCATLGECVATMATWSLAHPLHHPVLVLIEPKDEAGMVDAADWLADLETVIETAWGAERLIVPDEVQGAAADLRSGLAAGGWPPIDALRGRALFVLHDGGGFRDAYTEGGTTTAGRSLFPDAMGDAAAPFAAVHTINDPIGDFAAIGEVVALGHLVRTRADADGVEEVAVDTTRRDMALASGAHFVSTDWPEPSDQGYVVTIPDGTPSRCNPLTAPPGCTSSAIEDL
jgi:hypothetical protein